MKPTDEHVSLIGRTHQQAEQELLHTREALELKTEQLAYLLSLMRATLESASNGILVTDSRGNVTDFNERYLEMWQVPREVVESAEHRRMLMSTSHHFHDPQQVFARIDEIYTTSPPESFDVLKLLNGRTFERSSRTQSVNERIVGRVWNYRDITETRRAEEALRDESRILELLNETGIKLSSTLDLQKLVQTITDAATQLAGARYGAFFYHARNVEGDLVLMRMLSGDSCEAPKSFEQTRTTSLLAPAFTVEGPIRCEDIQKDSRYSEMGLPWSVPAGGLGVCSYLAVPVKSCSGEFIGSLFLGHPQIGVFTERVERLVVGLAGQAAVAIDNARLYAAARTAAEDRARLLESERLARNEAERASATKDEFVALLSHELKTPLSAILGWSQVLQFTSRTPADLERGLETIERNARVQSQLIDDLLDMGRITSGKLRLDIQPVAPSTIIESAIETVKPAADAKSIRLEKLLDTAAGPISGDPNRLQQILWNLLSNAVKFTPKGGKVQILLERVNSHIEISVADTGVGIDQEFLPHVFERFRQADTSTSRTFGGLGLGLSIVKHLVELHGGTVEARSTGIGCGTTFTVNLPLMVVHREPGGVRIHPKASNPVIAGFQHSDLSGIKVLVVDDERDACELIKRVLAECSAGVLTATNATEALLLVERESPQILITDIGMPDVDGYELLRRVRALGPARGGKIPAIALTAFARSEDRTRALRAGFLVHISKPVEPSELIATVASVAGRTGEPGTE